MISYKVRYGGNVFSPVLEYAASLFPKNHLKNVYVIACQHILPSTHLMIRSMFNIGLDRDNIAVIGKCYSTNHEVMQNMLDEGIFVCESSNKFDSGLSFDEQFSKSVANFLKAQIDRMKPPKDSTIVILDDGGELIFAAQGLSGFYKNIFGVEQTSSGYHKLSNVNLAFPVKNIALSKEKLGFETPLVAKSVVANLEEKLSLSTSSQKDILVVGKGCVGEEVYDIIRSSQYGQHNVSAYDIAPEKSDIEYLDLSRFDIIIGATGRKMLTYNYYDTLKSGSVLVSVSSSDREFDAVHFRKLSGRMWEAHDDVFYNGVRLLNCGFPLNFSGQKTVSIPLEQIQLVCSLLLLGVCDFLDISTQPKRFVRLSQGIANNIMTKFSSITEHYA